MRNYHNKISGLETFFTFHLANIPKCDLWCNIPASLFVYLQSKKKENKLSVP